MEPTTTIYIIDDDLDDQNFLIEAIKGIDESIVCYTASNGQEGLNKLLSNAVPFPSMIFLDLNMPRINGRKVLKSIKSHPQYSSIPVVIYTTSEEEEEKLEVMELGAANFLVKGADFLLLKQNLAAIIPYNK